MGSSPLGSYFAAALSAVLAVSVHAESPLPPGSRDPSFPALGAVKGVTASSWLSARDLHIAPDGSFFLLSEGGDWYNGPYTEVVSKFTSIGQPDTAFGASGDVVLSESSAPGSLRSLTPRKVALTTGGKVLVAGHMVVSGSGASEVVQIMFKRLTPAGALDTTFGVGGTLAITGRSLAVNALEVLPDDSCLLLATQHPEGSHMVLIRVLANGTLDPAFGTQGVASLAAPSNRPVLSAKALHLMPDGRLQVHATAHQPGLAADMLFLRLNSDGSPDATYGTDGLMAVPMAAATSIAAVAIDARGRTLVTGQNDTPFVGRFTPAGEWDWTLGGEGTVPVSYSGGSVVPVSVAVHSSGRILVATLARDYYTTGWGALSLRPDGTLDTSFGVSGAAMLSSGNANKMGGLRLQDDGKPVVFGSVQDWSVYNPARHGLMRFTAPATEVWSPPQILTPPEAGRILLHDDITLKVVLAPNTLRPVCRWRKSGQVISGQHGPELTIHSASLADAGSYTVEVANEAGVLAPTAAVVLTVDGSPQLLSKPQSVKSYSNGSPFFDVSAAGLMPMTFQWRKDGQLFGAPRTATDGKDRLTLPPTVGSEGVYTVEISNSEGSITTDPVACTLLNDAPAIIMEPQSVDAPDGVYVTFTVKVTGRRPLTFQWLRNGQNSDVVAYPDTNDAAESVSTAHFPTPASKVATSTFRCVITNAFGSVTSAEAVCASMPSPGIAPKAPRVLARTGAPLTLGTRLFSADRVTRYDWFFNGKAVVGAYGPALELPSVTFANAGGYVTVVRTLGQWQSSVKAATSAAASVAVIEGVDRTVSALPGKTVSLTVQSAGDGLSYVWRRIDGQPVTQARYAGATARTLTITGFNPATDAAVYCCAVSRTGVTGPPLSTGLITLIQDVEKPALQTAALAPGAVAQPYRVRLAASSPSARFTVTGLPPGLLCDPATGIIAGLPSKAGDYKVRIVLTNTRGPSAAVTLPLAIALVPRAMVGVFTGPLIEDGVVTSALTVTLSESGAFSASMLLNDRLARVESFRGLGRMVCQPDGSFVGVASRRRIRVFSYDPSEFLAELVVRCAADGALTATWRRSLNGQALSDGTVVLSKNLWHSVTRPATAYAGYYTAAIAPTGPRIFPQASGIAFASFTVTAGGTFTFTGRLPDGTAFAVPCYLNQSGASWLHLLLYKYHGHFSGTFSLSLGAAADHHDNGITGNMVWNVNSPWGDNQPPVYNPYVFGFTYDMRVLGARYVPPASAGFTGPLLMNAAEGLLPANVTLTVSGGGLDDDADDVVLNGLLTAKPAATFTATDDDAAAVSKITFNAATGAFSGTVLVDQFGEDDGSYLYTVPASFYGIVTRPDPASPVGYGVGSFYCPVLYRVTEYIWYLDHHVFWRVSTKFTGSIVIDPVQSP